jgi:hypothetical protein
MCSVSQSWWDAPHRSGDIGLHFAPSKARQCLLTLVPGQFRRATKLDATRHCTGTPLANSGTDQFALELSETAEDREHEPAVGARGIADTSCKDLNPAPRSDTVARTFRRSRVERASRSNRVMTSTSPGSNARSAFVNSARSDLAPETFSRKSLVQLAVVSSATCGATSCPFVLTRAYPKIVM